MEQAVLGRRAEHEGSTAECSHALRLVCIRSEDDAAGRVVELPHTGAFVIGRRTKCDWPVHCSKVSYEHCTLYMSGSTPDVDLEDQSMNGTWRGTSRIGKGNRVRLRHGDQVALLAPVSLSQDRADLPFAFELRYVPVQPPSNAASRLGRPHQQPWVTETRSTLSERLSTRALLLQPGHGPPPLCRAPKASHQQLVEDSLGRSLAAHATSNAHSRDRSTIAAHATDAHRLEQCDARWQGAMTGRRSTAGAVDDVASGIISTCVHSSRPADLNRGCARPSHHIDARFAADRAAVMPPDHAAQPVKESKARPYRRLASDPRRRLAEGSVRHVVLPAGADPLDQVQPSSRCVTATATLPNHVTLPRGCSQRLTSPDLTPRHTGTSSRRGAGGSTASGASR